MTSRMPALLITVLLALALTEGFAGGQQRAKIPRIGYLGLDDPTSLSFKSFRQGLRELGYIEGQTVIIEPRFAYGSNWQLDSLAVEMIRLNISAIVTQSSPALHAAMGATRAIPIVMAYCCDPVASGVVDRLDRPGGNVTGVAGVATELGGKLLELVKETVPGIRRVGMLWSLASERESPVLEKFEAAARSLRLELQPAEVRRPRDLGRAFTWATRGRAHAFIVLPGTVFYQNQDYIADLALKKRLPGIYWRSEFATAGGLMAYGANEAEQFRRAAYVVDKILKGARPAELPVELPTKFELVINLKTAKEIGITIHPEVLMWADRVIK